jgi:hypothetical protein
MAITWNTDEIEKIKNQTLNELRPSYYYVPNRSMVQITEDMEGYLILQDQEQKQKLLSWIKNVTKIETSNEKRDQLLATYLEIRQQDALDRITELDEVLNQYADMQAELITDGDDSSRYATIGDLNIMLRSITKPVDVINIQRDQAFHEQNVTTALQNLLEANKSNTDTQKEISSWQSVISAYKGQTAKSGKKKVGIAKMGNLF